MYKWRSFFVLEERVFWISWQSANCLCFSNAREMCGEKRIKLTDRKPLSITIVCFGAIRYYWVDSESSSKAALYELLKAFSYSAKPAFVETTQVDIKEEVLFSKTEDDCGLTIFSRNFANELVMRKYNIVKRRLLGSHEADKGHWEKPINCMGGKHKTLDPKCQLNSISSILEITVFFF